MKAPRKLFFKIQDGLKHLGGKLPPSLPAELGATATIGMLWTGLLICDYQK